MRSRISKRVLLGLILLLILSFAVSCGGKKDQTANQQEKMKELQNTGVDAVFQPEHEKGDTETGYNETEEVVLTATPTPEAPPEPVMVDGYNIAAATTGVKLKDAYKQFFSIGVAINGSAPSNATIKSAAMSEILKYHFNSTTFSNLMKPSYLLDQKGSIENYKAGKVEPAVNFSSVIEGLDFAKENDIKMRGHVLVWHTQTPDWFFKEGFESTGNYVDKATMLERLEGYIRQVMEFTQTKYPGVIYCWDVVNEAVENSYGSYETESGFEIRTKSGDGENLWYKTIGVEYVEKAFEYARKYAAPEVKLFYNDYNTFQVVKTNSIYDLAFDLKEKGLIDGIGMQGYMDLKYPGISYGTDNFKDALEKFAKLGLEIQITELTIRSGDKSQESFEKQGKRYQELFQLLTEMDTDGGGIANITNVTFFGLMDEYLFYENNTEYHRLFDNKLQPKPAFSGVLEAVQD